MMNRSIIYRYKMWEQRRKYARWTARGKPMPPPHFVKQLVIKEFVEKHRLKVMVETGTYKGDMIRAMSDIFDLIYSIELSDSLYKQACQKFRHRSHIHLFQGDSGEEITKVLAKLKQPALFWLDGHYSAGTTAKGTLNTPISKELQHVLTHPVAGHVILIDDARLFNGANDYPTVETLRAEVAKTHPNLQFDLADDVIRFFPKVK